MTQDDQDEAWQTYAMDAEDALRDIEESLLSIEKSAAALEEINRLYRALHTLKGNSAVMGLTVVERLAHAAEDMVGLVRDRGASIDGDMVELMLQLVDRLGEITRYAVAERTDVDEEHVRELVERVHAWTLRHGGLVKETSLIGRGEIVVWSSLPPRSSAHAQPGLLVEEQITVEIFLAIARDALTRLFDGLAGTRGSEALRSMELASEDLRSAAERSGYADVATLANGLTQIAKHLGPESTNDALDERLVDLCAALDPIERRYAKCADCPQDFGMGTFFERARRALVERHHSTIPPLDIAAEAAAMRFLSAPAPHAEIVDSVRPLPAPQGNRASPTSIGRSTVRESSDDGGAKADFLRVDARKVSLLMDLTGEIALACSAVTHHPELDGCVYEGFSAAAHKLEVLIRELQNEVSAMRLVPVAGVFQRMRRVVRDTAKRTGKKVELTLIGEDTEIDRVMVDSLHDPLVHLLRNAIDHGIEPPDERARKGKSEVGSIVLEASHQGGEVSVRVQDDGGGLVRDKLRARAVQRGLITWDAKLSDEQTLNLIFLPGFSTKEKIDELSGRGVGMDVVKTTIEGLRGRVQVESTEGVGSRVDLTVPLTLAFVEAMIVRTGDRLLALPIEKVFEVFKAERTQLSSNSADGEAMVRVRERLVPVLWIQRFYGEVEIGHAQLEGRVIVVVQTSRGLLALPVDALLGNQPVMLKPLRGVLGGIRAAAGCAMLRSGDVALALDCEQLHE